MKRADALIPLSSEHHVALVLARQAVTAATDTATQQTQVIERTLNAWDQHIIDHLVTEETSLLPALEAAGERAAAATARAQHAALRALIERLRRHDACALAPWGEQMREHVKFEERSLFPLAERSLDLTAMRDALHRPDTRPASQPPHNRRSS